MTRLAPYVLLAVILLPNNEALAKAIPVFDAPYLVFSGGPSPNNLTLGDFNGDGHLDVATSNFGASPGYEGSVSIYLGNGDGTLCSPRTNSAGRGTFRPAAGDFDDDGLLDLVAFNLKSNDVTVYRGLGDGTLVELSTVPLGAEPTWSAVADVTHDGALDLIVATKSGIVTMVGDGSGGFTLTAAYASATTRFDVGEINGDGLLDIVTGRALLGQGDGTFVPGALLEEGYQGSPGTISLGDFDGDGILDIASLFFAEDIEAGVFRGRGDGTFEPAVTVFDFNASEADYGVFGDVTGDGNPDIILRAQGTDWGIRTIISPATTPIPPSPDRHEAGSIAVGDFNGDGQGDVASIFWHGVAVYLSNGDGTFGKTPPVGASGELSKIAIGDLTADGIPDILLGDELKFFLGLGDGTFVQKAYFRANQLVYAMTIGDVNLDGFGDLISARDRPGASQHRLEIRLGDGVSSFTSTTQFESTTDSVDIGDQNGDGWPDLFIIPNQIRYGTFEGGYSDPTTFLGVGRYSGQADFDQDGLFDVANRGGDAVWLTRGRGAGACGGDWGYGAGLDARQFAIGDLNGDGALDLAVVNLAWLDDSMIESTGDGPQLMTGYPAFTVLLNRNVRPITMDVDIAPRSLVANASHYGRWITASLEPPDGFDPHEIDITTVRLNGLVPVDPAGPLSIGDDDHDGVMELTVKFDRAAVALSIGNVEQAELIVTGDIGDEEFAGRDTIKLVRGAFERPAAGEVLPPEAPYRVLYEVSSGLSPELIYSPDGGETWTSADVIELGKGWIDWRAPSTRTERGRLALIEGLGSEKANVLAVSDDFAIRKLVDAAVVSERVELAPVWPNPSRGIVAIRFQLPHATAVHLDVFDLQGRKVEALRGGIQNAGWQEVRWDPHRMTAGLYFVHLKAAGVTRTQRILLLD